LISQGVPPLGGVKERWVGKTSDFQAKWVNISNTVGDAAVQQLRLSVA